ncbi:unnamed protein product [Calicophoron daubneyi]|uniref:SFI1 n=1 Tax=Calicophoron daubneyi TaxID=300641 RepID=A0AAV2U0Y5_CALDB
MKAESAPTISLIPDSVEHSHPSFELRCRKRDILKLLNQNFTRLEKSMEIKLPRREVLSSLAFSRTVTCGPCLSLNDLKYPRRISDTKRERLEKFHTTVEFVDRSGSFMGSPINSDTLIFSENPASELSPYSDEPSLKITTEFSAAKQSTNEPTELNVYETLSKHSSTGMTYSKGSAKNSVSLLEVACAHHRKNSLYRFFKCWSAYCQKRSKQGKILQDFKQMTKRRTLSKVFHVWSYTLVRIAEAKQLYKHACLSNTFVHWRSHTKKQRCLLQIACLHDVKICQQRVFWTWRQNSQLSSNQSEKVECLLKLIHLQRIRKCFSAWRSYITYPPRICTELEFILIRRQTTLILEVWRSWVSFIRTCHEAVDMASQFRRLQNFRTLSVIFNGWRAWTVRQKSVVTFRNSSRWRVLTTVFANWRRWTSSRRTKRNLSDSLIEVSNSRLHSLRLRHWIRRWQLALQTKQKTELAKIHANNVLIKRFIYHWRSACEQRKRKYSMKCAAERFHTITVLASCLSTWWKIFEETRRSNQLNRLALFRWSMCLQARVWSAWRLYVEEQRIESARIEAASSRFRLRYAREAVRILLSRALEERHYRHEKYCEKYWRSDHSTYYLVLNAATHWYWWMNKQKNNYSQLPPAPADPCESHKLSTANPVSCEDESGKSCLRCCEPMFPEFLIPVLQKEGITIPHPRFGRPNSTVSTLDVRAPVPLEPTVPVKVPDLNSHSLIDSNAPMCSSSQSCSDACLEAANELIRRLREILLVLNLKKQKLRLIKLGCLLSEEHQESFTECLEQNIHEHKVIFRRLLRDATNIFEQTLL